MVHGLKGGGVPYHIIIHPMGGGGVLASFMQPPEVAAV